jgi:hypothetical protein
MEFITPALSPSRTAIDPDRPVFADPLSGETQRTIPALTPDALHQRRAIQPSGAKSQPEENKIMELLTIISGHIMISALETGLGLKSGTLHTLIRDPKSKSYDWISKILLPKLWKAFPNKWQKVDELRDHFLVLSVTTAAEAKNKPRRNRDAFRVDAGTLLRELREACGQDLKTARESLRIPVLRRRLDDIESGARSVPGALFEDAIRECCLIYGKVAPAIVKAYIPQFEKLGIPLHR